MSKITKSIKEFIENFEMIVEKLLWGFRCIIVLGVVGLLVSSLLIFLLGTIETFSLLKIFIRHITENGFHFETVVVNEIIVHVIMTVDDFLLGIVLLIFGLGSYDLFISKIEVAEQAAKKANIRRPNWLKFTELDELKDILGKVVLMILIINFLKFVVKFSFDQPLEILYLAGGIFLIALALKFSYSKDIGRTVMRRNQRRKKTAKPG